MNKPRIYVYPYSAGSESASLLAVALNTTKLKRKDSGYNPRKGDVLVNWGASDFGDWLNMYDNKGIATHLNTDVRDCINKQGFFQRLTGTGLTPDYSLLRDQAEAHLKFPVVCRTKIKGRDGEGIVIAETKEQMIDAPLYVSYFKKDAEYRVYLVRGKQGGTSIMGCQRKWLPKEKQPGEGDRRIRTTANGCYFSWDENPPNAVLAQAHKAFAAFPELTFVGADIVYHKGSDDARVLEFNTAPELTPLTVGKLARFFTTEFLPDVVEEKADDIIEAFVPPPPVEPVAIKRQPKPAVVEVAAVINDEDNPDYQRGFKAGWQARKLASYVDMYSAPSPKPVQNYMYGIDVVGG